MITKQTKTDFIKWLDNQEIAPYSVMFDELPENIKQTYITQFFDSIGVFISCQYIKTINAFSSEIMTNIGLRTDISICNSRIEANMKCISIIDTEYNNKTLKING